MQKYCVIGSINMDLISRVERFPKPGETIIGESFATAYGGKGANQSVALSKLGCDVSMIGLVGNDVFGEDYKKEFKRLGINIDGVDTVKSSTGIAMIEVETLSSVNHIVLSQGANAKIDKAYIDSKKHIIKESSVCLFQLEIPDEITIYAMKVAHELGKITILDPAPAKKNLNEEIYKYADFITPNETETEILSGISVANINDAKKASEYFIKKGVKNIIIKAGKHGAYYINDKEVYSIEAYPVKTVDTTAAGDSFNAGLSFALGSNKSILEVLKTASAVASLSTTGYGAQSAMPSLEELTSLFKEYKDIEPKKH